MNRLEAANRNAAAIKRLQVADPAGLLLHTGVVIVGAFTRALVYLCIGFGSATLAGVSAWWGIPFAIVAAQTLGRVWGWWRRDALIAYIEQLADDAEKRVGSPK